MADRLTVLVWQDMPSPPALTCASTADGDPIWKREARQEAARQKRAGLVLDDGMGGGGTGAMEVEVKEVDFREWCVIDRMAFKDELEAMILFASFSVSIVLWVRHSRIFNASLLLCTVIPNPASANSHTLNASSFTPSFTTVCTSSFFTSLEQVIFNEGWGQHKTATYLELVSCSLVCTYALCWLHAPT